MIINPRIESGQSASSQSVSKSMTLSASNSSALAVTAAAPKFFEVTHESMSHRTSSASFAPLSLPSCSGSKYGWRAFSSDVYVSDWYFLRLTVTLR